ncbi:MAG: hypothetical protein Kow0069_37480 [Promethearchaeota archaeon]
MGFHSLVRRVAGGDALDLEEWFLFQEARRLANHRPAPPGLAGLLRRLVGRYGLDRLPQFLACLRVDHPLVRPPLPDLSKGPPPFLYDLHCHTRWSDGGATPKEVLRRVAAWGHLDGLAITDHPWTRRLRGVDRRAPNEKVVRNSFRAAREANALVAAGKLPEHFATFPGSAEFASRLDADHPSTGVELVGLGLPENFVREAGGLRRLRRLNALELVDAIHDAGGLVVLPHPFYFTSAGYSKGLVGAVDAFELLNHTTGVWADPATHPLHRRLLSGETLRRLSALFSYFNWRTCLLAASLGSACPALVGSSDAHVASLAGAAASAVPEPLDGLEGLRAALKRRRTAPCLNPRWEAVADADRVLGEAWDRWGGELAQLLGRLAGERPVASRLAGLASLLVKRTRLPPSC